VVASTDDVSDTSVLVRRPDGTLHQFIPDGGAGVSGFQTVVDAGGSPFLGSAIALSRSSSANHTHTGCAINSGNVWCFGDPGLPDSTLVGAGLGKKDVTIDPVEVVTAVGGPALADVQQIVGGTRGSPAVQPAAGANVANFCAVTSEGTVWCWGYGQEGELGVGDTSNGNYAREVLANASTAFSGAVEVRVGIESACARKSDGSIWCWGTSGYGELGSSQSALPYSFYPTVVSITGTAEQRFATRLISGPGYTYCAIMQDTSVVCWGRNDSNQAGATASATALPTRILVASGGAPFTGAIDVANTGLGTCARTSSFDIVCWGIVGTQSPYPFPFEDGFKHTITGVQLPLAGTAGMLTSNGNFLVYVLANGELDEGGGVLGFNPCR
jgi:hypothetical protein